MRWIAVLALGLSVAGQSAQARVDVTRQTMFLETERREIDIDYPVTGNSRIDAPIAAYAKEQTGLLDDLENEPPPGGTKYSVNFDYRVDRNDALMFAVSMSGDAFTGGAHGIRFMENFAFLMPDGWRVYLPELVDGSRGLRRVSELAIAQLTKTLLGKDTLTNENWIAAGAGPDARNFENFVWLSDRLVLTFMPYQVGPYVMGATEIEIPFSQLKDVIRADPRAPSPSFSCDLAKAPVEKVICSDALLARADRQTAELYANAMAGRGSESERTALRRQQRDFIADRDRSCGAKIDCLKKAYESRLAALKTL